MCHTCRLRVLNEHLWGEYQNLPQFVACSLCCWFVLDMLQHCFVCRCRKLRISGHDDNNFRHKRLQSDISLANCSITSALTAVAQFRCRCPLLLLLSRSVSVVPVSRSWRLSHVKYHDQRATSHYRKSLLRRRHTSTNVSLAMRLVVCSVLALRHYEACRMFSACATSL